MYTSVGAIATPKYFAKWHFGLLINSATVNWIFEKMPQKRFELKFEIDTKLTVDSCCPVTHGKGSETLIDILSVSCHQCVLK